MTEYLEGTILLVEDEPTDALMIRRALAKAGIANPVQHVADGDAAVAYLAGQGRFQDRAAHPLPFLLLLDLKLPRRSGHEVLAWLRASPALRRLPTVMLTGSTERADVDRAYELGANSYLVKPVELGRLVDLMSTVKSYWLENNQLPVVAGW